MTVGLANGTGLVTSFLRLHIIGRLHYRILGVNQIGECQQENDYQVVIPEQYCTAVVVSGIETMSNSNDIDITVMTVIAILDHCCCTVEEFLADALR